MKLCLPAACTVMLTAFAIGSPARAADVIVVAHREFREAFAPWVEMRQAEGLTIEFCIPSADRDVMAGAIAQAAQADTRYVLLVGDAPVFTANAAKGAAETELATRIPTFYLPSKATAPHGSTPTYPSDLPFTDFDGDGISDAAVGRLPVVTAEQLSGLVSRIIAYENSQDFGQWRRCLQLTAGVGGFGTLVDGAIESVTRTVLTSVLPADAKPQIAYASPGHSFCPTGEPFSDAVMTRYQSGSRFWVYAGHGSVDRLDFLTRSNQDSGALTDPNVPQNRGGWQVESLLNNQTASRLAAAPARAPIAVLLACYAGAYDAPGDCLSERMLLAPGGPIAVISASRLTMPYGNARFGLGLLESAYRPVGHPSSPERLGDATLAAVRRLQSEATTGENQPANPSADDAVSTTQLMVDGLAGLISPAGSDLEQERREHAGLYQLLGDPTLRLHRPQPLAMTLEEATPSNTDRPSSGRRVCVSITSPISGTLTVCVDRPLGTGGDAQFESGVVYQHDPHRCTLGQVTLSVEPQIAGKATIPIPSDWNGPVVVRGFVQGADGWASGAMRTLLLR